MAESAPYIRKVWIEGTGTICFGIPSEIVKKLKIDQNSTLLIDLVDDAIIVIKKCNPQFTKSELSKIRDLNNLENSEEPEHTKKPIKNPLDDLDL